MIPSRLHAKELSFRALVDVLDVNMGEMEAKKGAVWLWDMERDEFCGRMEWVGRAAIRVDPSCFIDYRKLIEKETGAYPGELGLDVDEESGDA